MSYWDDSICVNSYRGSFVIDTMLITYNDKVEKHYWPWAFEGFVTCFKKYEM